MSISYWLDNSKSKTVVSDVTIIGGGIAGLSAAYWLLKEDPNLSVSIVEKDRIGFGATGRNAGFITCGSVEHFNRLVDKHGKDEASEIWKFSEENLELLKSEIIQDEGEEVLFEQKGSFSLASTESEFAELKTSAELMSQFNIDVETLNESEIKSRLGALQFVGGIKYKGDASVHPIKMLNLISEKTKSLSSQLKIYEGSEVHKIDTKGDKKLVVTDQAVHESDLVVFATNGYSSLLHPFFEDKIFATKGQILVTEPVERFMEGPCYANFVLDYFRQIPTGEMIIGGFRQLEKETEVGFSDHTTKKIQLALEEFLKRHIPQIQGKKITHRWSGVMGFSVDGQPMVGSLASDPQIFFTGGFTAHGLGLAFNSGKKLADAIFGREIPKFLSARRF